MTPGSRRLLAVALAAVLLLPVVVAMSVVLHEMGHHRSASPREDTAVLAAVVHGHHHDARAAGHEHAAVKISVLSVRERSMDLAIGSREAKRVPIEIRRVEGVSTLAINSPAAGDVFVLRL